MHSSFNKLYRSIVANLDFSVLGQRHLRDAKRSWIRICGRSDELEGLDHGVVHVLWYSSQAKVDVNEGGFVTGEPARLKCNGAAIDRPIGSVLRCGHPTAWTYEQNQLLALTNGGKLPNAKTLAGRTNMDTPIASHKDISSPNRFPRMQFLAHLLPAQSPGCVGYSLSILDT